MLCAKMLCRAACMLLALLLAVPALAETVSPMPPAFDARTLASRTAAAGVVQDPAAAGMVRITLYDYETYAAHAVEALKPGDTIVSRGEAIAVQTVTVEWPYVIINAGETEFSEGSLYLEQTEEEDSYRSVSFHAYNRQAVAMLALPVPEGMLFLDGIDPEMGHALELPAVHSAEEFMSMLPYEEQYGVGFACGNVYAVFDARGELAILYRYYVPWQ